MFKQIKKISVKILKPKKAFLGFFIFFFFLFSFMPSQKFACGATLENLQQYLKLFGEELGNSYSLENLTSSGSSVASYIASPFIAIPAALIGGIFWILAVVTGGLNSLAVVLLQWVLSGNFLGDVSYTNPSNNPVIAEGLKITQSFVNMILVLALVFIALSTILRLKEYESKKLLVNFVIIALLVNFSPVICGLIVDASNITMNFFLQGIKASGSNLANSIKAPASVLKEWNWNNLSFDLQTIANFAIRTITITIINFFSFFIYLAFAFIFIVRYMAIWVLVILSPIAFACYVLPITKKYWTMWWGQFIQWCIIGITCSFFLHLAEIFITKEGSMIKSDYLSQQSSTIGATILVNFVPIIFLALALFMGLQTSAMGASTIFNWSTKARKASGKYLTRATAGRFLASETGKKISTGLSRIPNIREMGEGRGTLAKWALRAGGLAISPLAIPARTAGRYALSYGAAQNQQVEDRKKNLEKEFGKDYERAAATYSSILPGDWQAKAALARYLGETKGAKALDKLTDFQQRDLIETVAKYDPSKLEDMAKYKPELLKDPKVGKIMQQKVAKNMEELVGKMKPDDYKNVSAKAVQDTEFIDAVISKAMNNHIVSLIENNKEAAEVISKQIASNAAKTGQTSEKYLQTVNPRLHKFITEGKGKEYINLSAAPIVITPGSAVAGAPPTAPTGTKPTQTPPRGSAGYGKTATSTYSRPPRGSAGYEKKP